jgi:hypothetical protein
MGASMLPALEGFTSWIRENWPQIAEARASYDQVQRRMRSLGNPDPEPIAEHLASVAQNVICVSASGRAPIASVHIIRALKVRLLQFRATIIASHYRYRRAFISLMIDFETLFLQRQSFSFSAIVIVVGSPPGAPRRWLSRSQRCAASPSNRGCHIAGITISRVRTGSSKL